ncbi:hypothetical protein [Streptomyces sp. PU-14G]|uniref:hypothetical protein n=1 Tax=Streptomyces sp. PU-14G TaxID=2800808 RepID=UPI0034DE0A6A
MPTPPGPVRGCARTRSRREALTGEGLTGAGLTGERLAAEALTAEARRGWHHVALAAAFGHEPVARL